MSGDLPDVDIIENLVFNNADGNLEDYAFENELDTKLTIPYLTPSNVISNEEYPGIYEFEVCIVPVNSKQQWVYSAQLNKVFMDMLNPFPIDFKINEKSARRSENLFVRATPRYSHSKHLHDLVHRCINHEHIHEASNKEIKDPLVRQHIIRCHNPHTLYVGDKNKQERLSIIIPLSMPEAGTDSVTEMYEFVCKNSCPIPGMNRRPIEVIFTLETYNGQVLGRRVLNVRICSCPKRDKEKDEAELSNKPVPHGKKRKLNNTKTDKKPMTILDVNKDTTEYEIKLKIPGKHNVQQILKYCQDLMSGEVIRHSPHGTEGPFKKCLGELLQFGKPE